MENKSELVQSPSFRARLGLQLEEESHDAFELGRIVHGGAFELGKSRKH